MVRSLIAAGSAAAEVPLAEGLAHVQTVIHTLSGLLPGDHAVLDYTARLTRPPVT